MANLARFTINTTPSSPGGFDGTVSQVLTFALEGGPSNQVSLWTLEVFDSNDPASPLASKNAPALTLVGATSGLKVNATTPGSTITTTLAGSGVHTWTVRSTVNGGQGPNGADPNLVFERIIAIKTGSGLRKTVPAEGTQYSPRGWSDIQNDLIEAGAGPLLAPGGASHAHKVAAADAAGTNLQYAADIRLDGGGTALGFGGTRAGSGTVRGGTSFSIYGLTSGADRVLLNWSGNALQLGDVASSGVFVQTSSGGQFQVLFDSFLSWVWDRPGGPRLRAVYGGGVDAFIQADPSSDATDNARRNFSVIGQDVSGNTSTTGGTTSVRAGFATGAGGTHIGGNLLLAGGWATGASGTRHGGHVQLSPGAGGTTYGNTYLGTDFSPSINWQSAQRMLLVQNRIALATGDAPDGHFYGSDGGNPWWRFNGTSFRLDGTATTAVAGAQTLPSNPVGFVTITLNGTVRKIPYYAN